MDFSRLPIVATSIALSIGLGVLLYWLLVHSDAAFMDRMATLNRERLQHLRADIEQAKQRMAVYTSSLQSSEVNHLRLVRQWEQLQRIRSGVIQREQHYSRNWKAMRSVEFEEYLAIAFTLLGFQVETTRTSGDQGVDLIVSKGNFRIAVQVKGYLNSVGNSAIQEAFAGKAYYRCDSCAVITNSRFTTSAIDLARSTGCILIHENNFRDFVLGELDLLNQDFT